jgi:membrane protein
VSTLRRWWAAARHTRLYGAWKRYSDNRGNVLAGGVGYFAFFSIFPAVLLAFTVFGVVLQSQPQLLAEAEDVLNELLPGFVKTEDNPDGIIAVSAPTRQALTLTGLLSVAGLVAAGLGWLGAMRDAFRVIFGAHAPRGNPVVVKLRDLGVMVVLGVGVVISGAVGAVTGALATWAAGLVGFGGQGWVVTTSSVVVGVLLDAALVMFLLRAEAGVGVPWAVLRSAGLVGGIGLTALKKFGTLLLSGTLHSPLYASFALVVGLLLWLNLISRVILVAAAWAANELDAAGDRATDASGPAQGTVLGRSGQQRKLVEGPEPAPLTAEERTRAGLPTFGQPAVNRMTLVAGAVLGALGAATLGAALRGIRGLLVRR